MATISSGYTFVNNETVTPAKLNSLAGSASVSGIVDADISATAAIADTKLGTIATAGKVNNSATTATSANTASAIVARDSSGNFSAGTITLAGSLTATGDITAFSDARLKTNVHTISGALDLVLNLRGVTYDRVDTGKKSLGVIAQEVESVIPEVVIQPQDSEYLSVAYGNMVGVLIEAVKELEQRVRFLES